jgi:hypothetical protein
VLNIKFDDFFTLPDIGERISKNKRLVISPANGTVLTLVLNEVTGRNILIVVETMEKAEVLHRVLPDSILNPEFGAYPYENNVVDREIIEKKIKFIETFYLKKKKLIVFMEI